MSRSIDFYFTFQKPLQDGIALKGGHSPAQNILEVSLFQGDKVCYTLGQPIRILSFPVHHNYQDPTPHPAYVKAVTNLFSQFASQLPVSLVKFRWGFDPRKILQPVLYQEIEHQGNRFLFVVQFDLTYRFYWHHLIKRGDNNWTAEYETTKVIMSFDFLLLDQKSDSTAYFVFQFFDSTWIGEEGRGYYLQGIWMDDDLSEFFSRLLVSNLDAYYPFLPLRCRYQSLSVNTWKLSSDVFPSLISYLKPFLNISNTQLKEIQQHLKKCQSKQLAQLAQEYRSRLGLSSPSQETLPQIIEKRIAQNGLVEYVIDGKLN